MCSTILCSTLLMVVLLLMLHYISKAFDTVNHDSLLRRLVEIGLPPNVVMPLSKWYGGCMAWVRWGSCFSRAYNVTSGVRQGGILSPLLFNV